MTAATDFSPYGKNLHALPARRLLLGPWGDEMSVAMRDLAQSIAQEPGFAMENLDRKSDYG